MAGVQRSGIDRCVMRVLKGIEMLNWIPPEQAPKDGTQILAVFETYPFPVMAVWSAPSGTWCAAVPQVDMYQGELHDWYFENEHFPAEQLKVWGDVRHNALGQEPCAAVCARSPAPMS